MSSQRGDRRRTRRAKTERYSERQEKEVNLEGVTREERMMGGHH